MLTLTNVGGYILERGAKPGVDRDTLALTEKLIEERAPDVPRELRQVFDALGQAAVKRECPDYDADGNWKPQP